MAIRSNGFRLISAVLVLGAALTLGACAEKAKGIQLGASQFSLESLAAIDRIADLQTAAISVPPLPASQAPDKFVELVEGGYAEDPASFKIDSGTLDLLADPTKSTDDVKAPAWSALLGDLRGQYALVGSMFASLDQGSALAGQAVKASCKPVSKLTAQMAAFAKILQANPTQLLARRARLASQIETAVRKDTPPNEKRAELLQLREVLLGIIATEKKINDDAVAQALKAARMGLELRKLVINYDKLSLDDLLEGISFAFSSVGTITGRDLSNLQSKTDGIVAELTATPELKALVDAALERAGQEATAVISGDAEQAPACG